MTVARLYGSSDPMRNDRKDIPQHKDNVAAPLSIAQTAAGTRLRKLTPRQWCVFLLLSEALSNKAIAAELNVKEPTIKGYVSVILRVAGCRNRTEAALLSQRVRFGLLDKEEGEAGSRGQINKAAAWTDERGNQIKSSAEE